MALMIAPRWKNASVEAEMYANKQTTLYQGDARYLTRLPIGEASVHCVITSPPYYGQRNYGLDDGIGLESSVSEYVANLVEVGRQIWRVLRDDGIFFLNLGDVYVGSGKGMNSDGSHSEGPKQKTNKGTLDVPLRSRSQEVPDRGGMLGLKPKNLVGLPWRVLFALQEDGWIHRDDIIWYKLNPMTEAVRDRPTRAHEFIFMLVKSYRPLFWTHDSGTGARVQPEPDYFYRDVLTGAEYEIEPTDWSDELADCPDCAAGPARLRNRPGKFRCSTGFPGSVRIARTVRILMRSEKCGGGSVSIVGRPMITFTMPMRCASIPAMGGTATGLRHVPPPVNRESAVRFPRNSSGLVAI